MREIMRSIALVLDGFTMIGAVCSLVLICRSMNDLSTTSEFLHVAAFALLLTVIPYCLAGAYHRIYSRK